MALGKAVEEVGVLQWSPSKVVDTNCFGAELALVVEALVVMGLLAGDHEVETMHGGTSFCPQLRGSQSPRCPQGSIQEECHL